MPELPEVEVTRLGITPHLEGQRVVEVVVRQPKLRWPVSPRIQQLVDQRIDSITRRAKYLLLHTKAGVLILHLGMSGSLRVLASPPAPGKHDHLDLVLTNGAVLRLNDPRRFGAAIWWELPLDAQPLLSELGPEPLSLAFDADYLASKLSGKQRAIKLALMDNKVVVGVGNIYANEALFKAGIDPRRPAGDIDTDSLARLVEEVKIVLAEAIRQGGTTLRDFTSADGAPGYFVQQLNVYGRGGKDCFVCGTQLEQIRLGQRATVYCPSCQS